MELQAIIDALTANPTLIDGLLPVIVETEKGKTVLESRVDAAYKSKIGEAINETHSKYDDDLYTILGERAGQKADGTKEKTYEKLKSVYAELKELRTKKDSLTKEAEVARLTAEIETLKKEGGGKHFEQILEQAKAEWTQKEQGYISTIKEQNEKNTQGLIDLEISNAISKLSFNPDLSETIRNVVLENEKKRILQNAKLEDGKVVFYTPDGKPMLNPTTYAPMTAAEVVEGSQGIKEISLKVDNNGGGGAPTIIKGNIETTTVEGKDTKKLKLPAGSFKSKIEFNKIAEKALTDEGFTMRDPEWTTLLDGAYNDYKVSDLPRE